MDEFDSAPPGLGPRPPRWAAFAALLAALPLALLFGGLALGVSRSVFGSEEGSLAELGVGLVATQLALALVACAASRLSPASPRDSLGLGRGRMSLETTLALVAAVPLLQLAGMLISFFLPIEPGEALVEVHDKLARTRGWATLAAFGIAMLAPAIGEELLFRGFFLRALGAWAREPASAVLVSAIAFSAYHLDPAQALAVLPLSLWLSWLAWRADALWPAVLGHALHNGMVLCLLRSEGSFEESTDALPEGVRWLPVVWALSIVCVWHGSRRLRFEPRPR